jgi:V/A-type H+-transporting ATPase subunit F
VKVLAEEITIIKEKEPGFMEHPGLPDKIIVIGDSATVAGFKLAGVTEVYVAEDKDAERKLAELLDREHAGIIIVNESVIAGMDWRLKKKIEAIAKPVVVGVPDKTGPSKQVESLNEMIKRALGFELGGK